LNSIPKESSRHVEAVVKALQILNCFQNQTGLSLKQIVEMTGLNRSRVLRLAGTLQSQGFLYRDPDNGVYSLGSQVFALGKAFERQHDLISLARPFLRKSSQETGESVSLWMLDGLQRVSLAREEGTHQIRFSVDEGQRVELYAGASGKVLLAFGPPNVLEEILTKQKLTQVTRQTIVDPEDLRQELQKIREQGYAISYGERVDDSGSIAAPIFGVGNRMVCSLSVSGPSSRFQGDDFKVRLNVALKTARTLSARLGASIYQDGLQVIKRQSKSVF
jgi:DNA-binding IclR family transcriptional regulator